VEKHQIDNAGLKITAHPSYNFVATTKNQGWVGGDFLCSTHKDAVIVPKEFRSSIPL